MQNSISLPCPTASLHIQWNCFLSSATHFPWSLLHASAYNQAIPNDFGGNYILVLRQQCIRYGCESNNIITSDSTVASGDQEMWSVMKWLNVGWTAHNHTIMNDIQWQGLLVRQYLNHDSSSLTPTTPINYIPTTSILPLHIWTQYIFATSVCLVF